jgi:hypothetical protein
METCLVIEEQTGTKTDPTEKATGALSEPKHCNWVLLRAAERESRSERESCPLTLTGREDIYPNNVGVYLQRTEFYLQTERDYCWAWASDPCSSEDSEGHIQWLGVMLSWNSWPPSIQVPRSASPCLHPVVLSGGNEESGASLQQQSGAE